MSDAAITRVARFADDWFLLPVPPEVSASAIDQVTQRAAALGRPRPTITASMMAMVESDPTAPDHGALVRSLIDPDGAYGMPAHAAADVVVTGSPAAIAERVAALEALGAHRAVITIGGGAWFRQAELLAEARAQLGRGAERAISLQDPLGPG